MLFLPVIPHPIPNKTVPVNNCLSIMVFLGTQND